MINKRFDLKKLKDLLNEALEEQKKVDLGKLLDERTASKAFVAITMKNASNMWPDIKAKRMAPYVRGKLVTETDEVASLDLGLVLIALGINQIGNLFPKEAIPVPSGIAAVIPTILKSAFASSIRVSPKTLV